MNIPTIALSAALASSRQSLMICRMPGGIVSPVEKPKNIQRAPLKICGYCAEEICECKPKEKNAKHPAD